MVTQCPTYYGRFQKQGTAVDMLKWQKEHTVTVAKAASLPPHVLKDKIITGVLVNKITPEYTESHLRLRQRLKDGERQ
jgi:2-oxoglutarate/2-oxoacid ferredoxin oxidoreductase subunit beta